MSFCALVDLLSCRFYGVLVCINFTVLCIFVKLCRPIFVCVCLCMLYFDIMKYIISVLGHVARVHYVVIHSQKEAGPAVTR